MLNEALETTLKVKVQLVISSLLLHRSQKKLESTLSNKIHSVDRDGVIIHYQEHKKHFGSLHSSLSVFKIIKPEFYHHHYEAFYCIYFCCDCFGKSFSWKKILKFFFLGPGA